MIWGRRPTSPVNSYTVSVRPFPSTVTPCLSDLSDQQLHRITDGSTRCYTVLLSVSLQCYSVNDGKHDGNDGKGTLFCSVTPSVSHGIDTGRVKPLRCKVSVYFYSVTCVLGEFGGVRCKIDAVQHSTIKNSI